jgi:hypothetical protein
MDPPRVPARGMSRNHRSALNADVLSDSIKVPNQLCYGIIAMLPPLVVLFGTMAGYF